MTVRTLRPALAAAAMAVGLAIPAYAQDGQAAGGQTPPATQGQGRPMQQIMADLQQVQGELMQTMSSPSVLTNPETRDAAAEKAVPVLKRLTGLMEEAAAAAPNPALSEQLRAGRYQVQAILVGFGDQQTKDSLTGQDSLEAKSALTLGAFIAANEADGKMAAVKELDALATENPENNAVAQTAMQMFSLAEGNEELRQAARTIVTEKLKGPAATQFQQLLQMEEQAQKQAQEFEAKFIGKLLKIEGKTLQGETFSTESLKGKVVMVDFWATWCGPCIAALPKVKEDYAKYHDQGFEIVAVSLDNSADPLKKFLAENPEMTWTQIFTEGDPQASAKIAQDLGITAIPTVYLLDKNGVVRGMAVGGGEQMDKLHKMIPELLKEEASANSQ